jgi:hypothetical protein
MNSFCSVILLLISTCALPALASEVTAHQVRADHATLEAARDDYRRRAPHLGPAERDDYAAYIRRLEGRFARDCATLARSGTLPPPELSCPPEAGYGTAVAPVDQRHEQSREEATSALDAELGTGLGAFDQRLLREQERVKAEAPKTAASGAGGGGGGTAGQSGGDGGDAGATAGQSGASGAETAGAGESGRERARTTAAGPSGEGTGVLAPPPPDIPDGSDDDVVARQLREAAQSEPDPELRDKLWDEYRKYKQGTR